jgi:hypothetical protein
MLKDQKIPEEAKPAVPEKLDPVPTRVPVQPVETNRWDELFLFKPDDVVKGFIFSQILARPRSGQRGGNPWRSRY